MREISKIVKPWNGCDSIKTVIIASLVVFVLLLFYSLQSLWLLLLIFILDSERVMLWIGCSALYILVVSFLIFLATISPYGEDAMFLFILFLLLAHIGLFYYFSFSAQRLTIYKQMLIKKAKESLKLPSNSEVLTLHKKGATCNAILKRNTRKEYKLSFIFLTDDYLTIVQECPRFHIFCYERHGRDKQFKIKDSCLVTKEYRYSYIQSVHYDPKKKALIVVLTSGYEDVVSSEKKDADKAIIKIRERLRDTQRTIQTNLWHGK